MPNFPLASIIIPVYNQAEFLPEAVASALRQSWPNLEILIIDDASTDGTSSVISRYKGNPRISACRNPENLDCARTFNRGIALAQGKYFGILAADDTWEPTFLERCISALERHPEAAFAYTRLNLIKHRGRKKPRTPDRIPHVSDCCCDEFCNIVRMLNPIPHHATVVRKSALEEVGGYDEDLVTTHDWDLWLRLAEKFKVVFINEPLSNYRVHSGNVSKTRSHRGEKEKYILKLLDRVFSRDDLPETLRMEKDRIYAKAWLDIAEGYRVIQRYDDMYRCVKKTLSLSRNFFLFLPYRRLLLSSLRMIRP